MRFWTRSLAYSHWVRVSIDEPVSSPVTQRLCACVPSDKFRYLASESVIAALSEALAYPTRIRDALASSQQYIVTMSSQLTEWLRSEKALFEQSLQSLPLKVTLRPEWFG